MDSYFFFFGRSPELSTRELSMFFPTVEMMADDVAKVDAASFPFQEKELPMEESLQILGGTTKVARYLGSAPDMTPEIIASYLLVDHPHRIEFGISSYAGDTHVSSQFLKSVKDILESEGATARFLFSRHGETLSSVAVSRQDVFEINVCKKDGMYFFSRTIAVQEFEAWNKRDYGRPYADPKSGMLPPKVSRMIATIGLGNNPKGKTLLDPFCGMGTVLGEAMLLGATVIGSDYLPDVVMRAESNCAWLEAQYPGIQKPVFYTADATHISEKLPPSSVDVIATEPFMGSNKLGEGSITDKKKIENIMKGLVKLYLGCLKEWHTVLKPGGVIVMAFPEVTVGKTVCSVKKVIDSCEKLGYTLRNGPLPYGRPQAIVKRMIYEFIKL